MKEEDVPAWAKKRREICNTCPLNSKHTKKKDINLRWMKWWFLNTFQNFCNVCGCQIKPKTLAETEECPKDKWKEIKI